MNDDAATDNDGDFTYQEREATAIFPDEASLDRAVDALMQLGLRQEDMSVLAHSADLSSASSIKQLADTDTPELKPFVSSDSQVEATASLVGGPALLAGLGAAVAITTAGTALIPAIVVTAGSTLVGGGVGTVLARIFGRKHASYIGNQIAKGGVVLWVHAPDKAQDKAILDILAKNGGADAHIHVVNRQWGVSSIPFHDAQPDPLLRL